MGNVGLALFADSVRDQGKPVENVDWRIPGGGDPAVVSALTSLYGMASERVERANAEVVRRLDSGVALLRDIAPAIAVVPDIDDRTILHCGPAIEWAQMCDPLRRSVRAAVVAELSHLDRVGVERGLILPNYGIPVQEQPFSLNNLVLDATQHSERLVGGPVGVVPAPEQRAHAQGAGAGW